LVVRRNFFNNKRRRGGGKYKANYNYKARIGENSIFSSVVLSDRRWQSERKVGDSRHPCCTPMSS
jgi:hypothetical protein